MVLRRSRQSLAILTEVTVLFRKSQEESAIQAGQSDGKAGIPLDDTHPPFVRRVAKEGEVALDVIATRREEFDRAHHDNQRRAAIEYKEAGQPLKDPLHPWVRTAMGGAVAVTALASSFAALHQLDGVVRVCIAAGFAAGFTVGAALRLGIGTHHGPGRIRVSAADVVTAAALGCCGTIGFAIEWGAPWTPIRWATAATVTSVLVLGWFAFGTVMRSHPPVAELISRRVRADALARYRGLIETRRGVWRVHSDLSRAVADRAVHLMHVYYTENLLARRNTLTPEVVRRSGEDLPAIDLPGWIEAEPEDLDPDGLGHPAESA